MKNIRLGFFVAAGTLLFVTGMYFIGEKQSLFSNTFSVKAVFNNVNGLQAGNTVRLAGIDIGTVDAVWITSDSTVMVSLAIDEDARRFIKSDAVAIIGTDGLMGNQIVNIGSGSTSAGPISAGDTLKTFDMLLTDDVFRTLAETNVNVAIVAENLANTIQDINKGKGPLGKLLKDEQMATDLQTTAKNVEELTASMTQISRNIEHTLAAMKIEENYEQSLLTDQEFANDLRQTVKEIKSVGENANELTSELKKLIQDLNMGEGSAGRLLTDTAVVNSLERSLIEIEQGAEGFNENMEALKHNILFRRYFKTKAKKEEKQKKEADE